eukprot:a341696_94.p2 GENE.a341696_94~~a341696_94.p2  ORF type:complete len:153 (+),score=34.67 a341696_94:42-461(+)
MLAALALGLRSRSRMAIVSALSSAASVEKGFHATFFRREGETREQRMRRLKYQTEHRGIVENELLLATFFRAHGESLSPAELDMFEDILTEQDQDLFKWLTRKTEAPERFDRALVDRLRAHVESDPMRNKRKDPSIYIG